ncbi:MAG: alkaline phosphatase [Propionibacteriaceae bacterium]|nr:alkaline phosphatase [Propionibacteriaceae bacterium]
MKRSFTAFASVCAAGVMIVSAGVASPAYADKGRSSHARNIIYLVGDGMGRTHIDAGRLRYFGANGSMAMETLPVHGFVKTYAVEKNSAQPGEPGFAPNYVTDSASAATAWSSGVKTYNAALGIDPEGNVKPTVMEMAKKAGYRTGNVSTAEITDATPAGQMSHVLARGCQGPTYSARSCQDTAITGTELPTSDIRVTPVAKQIARNGTADVILGGGLSRFDAADEEALRAQGYDVLSSPADQTVATRDDLAGARGDKVFGLFNKGNLTVEKSKRLNPGAPEAQEPTLAEMTAKSIELLTADGNRHKGRGHHARGHKGRANQGKGFYLQVEGALIDKRSHANDAGQTLEEQKAFDDAVKVAFDFAKRDRNTLVIVTADHECAGFNIIEQGTFTNAEAANPPVNVDGSNPANSSTPSRPAGTNTKDATRSTGIINGAGADDPHNFAPATFRTPDDAEGIEDGSPEASLWLSYLSGNHTGADVPVYAYGPGSGKMQGTIDNTDLFDIFTDALRLR